MYAIHKVKKEIDAKRALTFLLSWMLDEVEIEAGRDGEMEGTQATFQGVRDVCFDVLFVMKTGCYSPFSPK